MNVFIDTNIILSFFHFTKDDIEKMNTVHGSHLSNSAKLHLTQQVYDEFIRNRESKIKDALKRFEVRKYEMQLPYFMKDYSEYDDIQKLNKDLNVKSKLIIEKINKDVSNNNLLADRLINDIFKQHNITQVTQEIFDNAYKRMIMGNPPGKKNSIGDAINWIILLESVPKTEDLHIISADGDFYSILNENAVNPFLEDEWKRKKESDIFVYRTLSEFTFKHFNRVAFSFDNSKASLIDKLMYSSSFTETHSIIANLTAYPYFSLLETERILNAAVANGQFGSIVTDCDISDFLSKIAVHHRENLSDAHTKILDEVIEKQAERQR